MDRHRALPILQALADGIDPYTGEVFDAVSPYQHPETVRALFAAVEALEQRQRATQRRLTLPERAGQSWTEQEDQALASAYDRGWSIADLARRHRRTRGAITSRLIRLGKMQPPATSAAEAAGEVA